MLMQTMGDVVILGDPPQGMFSSWLVLLSPGLVSNRQQLLSKPNILLCLDAHSKWMQSWLDEVAITYDKPGVIKGNNKGVIALTKTELVDSEAMLFEQVPSADNFADLFTKAPPSSYTLGAPYGVKFLHL